MPLPLALGLIGGGAVVAHSGPALMPLVPPLAKALGVPRTLPGDPVPEAVAITFDDGPHPVGTPAVLEILADRAVHATFFLVGERVRANPNLAAEITAAGHRVALHCDQHRNALRLTGRQIREDIARAKDTIQAATGVECDLQRAPLGIYTPAFLRAVKQADLQPWLWSQWGRDWRARATPDSIIKDASETVTAGDVVLLHDGDDYSCEGSHLNTVKALPRILNAVQTRNLDFVALP
ncbi:MAG: polysaccharide deacetylase family protein [Actinomycetes bacterium]